MHYVDGQAPLVKVSVDLRPALFADAFRRAVQRAGGSVVSDGHADVRVVGVDSDERQGAGAGELAVVIVPSDGGGPITVRCADGTTLRIDDLAGLESWLRVARSPD